MYGGCCAVTLEQTAGAADAAHPEMRLLYLIRLPFDTKLTFHTLLPPVTARPGNLSWKASCGAVRAVLLPVSAAYVTFRCHSTIGGRGGGGGALQRAEMQAIRSAVQINVATHTGGVMSLCTLIHQGCVAQPTE